MLNAHRFPIRVYYEDTDAGGVVYHANYLNFAERARTEMLRSAGVAQEALRTATGLGFVVHRCTAEFIQAARLDDELVVVTRITAVGGASIEFHQQIERSDTPIARLTFQIVCVGGNGRPHRLPSDFDKLSFDV
jgi:acyl-CoA thioester hydrolase